MNGSKINLWKQDPSVGSLGIQPVLIPGIVNNGPKDDLIEIKGLPLVTSDVNSDFLFELSETEKFDACSTYASVRLTLNVLTRALVRNNIGNSFRWQWGLSPIQVFPHAGNDRNAFYDRNSRSLKFFSFHSNITNETVFTCRSFDIVAHELGHAFLDAIKPDYITSQSPQTGGLHEAFGDLTAIFAMLSQLDICNAIIVESKADLHSPNFFSSMGEQFGEALFNHRLGLRNADNNLKLSEVSTAVHQISQVFTGAVYDILVDFFEDHQSPSKYDQAESLFRVGRHVTDLVLLSIISSPDRDSSFADVARQMIEIEPDETRKQIIRDQFSRREVFQNQLTLQNLQFEELDWSGCSHTLNNESRIEQIKKSKHTH